MPSALEHIAARLALLHARGVYRRFERSLERPEDAQRAALNSALQLVRRSEFARHHGLDRVRDAAELRRAMPLQTYETLRPWIDRVAAGQTSALFAPSHRVLMFATSSGTTAEQKLIPVTPEFVRSYRRGWNIFGLKMLTDHPAAILRSILQVSGRSDERRSPAGIPCGAITGLLARTQKGIVRRFYVGGAALTELSDPLARHYALMRLGIVRDVAFAVTANPATLIRLAKIVDEHSESILRDVRDGTISSQLVPDLPALRTTRAALRPMPERATELERLRSAAGVLRPSDYWRIEFLACWTGGSMGLFGDRVRQWYGPLPTRDIGLLASEGRVSIPLKDGTPAGVLDVAGSFFEFIPIERWHEATPPVLSAGELEAGREYAVVLSNSAGLIRYRLDDVVRVEGFVGRTPIVAFLYRAGGVASVVGEKLTEQQVVTAVAQARAKLGYPEFDFVIGPRWSDPPFYQLTMSRPVAQGDAEVLDECLQQQNVEYADRRKSLRLSNLRVSYRDSADFTAMDMRLLAARRSTGEQYKRVILFSQVDADADALGPAPQAL